VPQYIIDSLDDPRLEPYRQLKDTNRTRWFGRFVAEGEKLTQRLLANSCEVVSVLVDRTHLERLRPHLRDDLDVLVVTDRLVPQIVGFNFHRGVLACGRRPENVPLEQIAKRADTRLRLVVLPDVQDPENLGTIIRTSAAFDIDAVLLGGACADPFSRRVLRTSMGAVWRVPLRQSDNLAEDLRRLCEEFDVQLAATVVTPDAQPLAEFAPPRRLALLLGNEGHGLKPAIIAQCQHRLTLPMQPGTDSLNVSVAAGIFLYHLAAATSAGGP
jgi:tRNA G18 (ribose-2'-O)-methylase SpoU